MTRRVLVCAALALVFASPAAAARSWALPQIKLVTAKGLMGGTANGFRPDDPLTPGRARGPRRRADRHGGARRGEPERAGDDRPARRPARPRARPAPCRAPVQRRRRALPGSRPAAGFGTEVVARLLGLRVDHPAAQDAPRAPRHRPGHARRGGLLGRAHPRLRRLGGGLRWRSSPRPSSSRPLTGLQQRRAPDRDLARRLPVRLGRDERAAAGSVRAPASRCPAASTAPASSGASTSCRPTPAPTRSPRPQGPHDLRDERRGHAGAADPARAAPARRPPLLRRARRRGRSRPRSTTWASTSATAGSSTPRTRASRSRRSRRTGTRSASPGAAGRSPKPALLPAVEPRRRCGWIAAGDGVLVQTASAWSRVPKACD